MAPDGRPCVPLSRTFKANNKPDVLDRFNKITKIKILTVIIAVQNQSTKFLTCSQKSFTTFLSSIKSRTYQDP